MTDAQILAAIKKSEGWPKYTNHPADLGGNTKGGITLDTLRVWRKNPRASVDDLKALTETEADAIYVFMYLQPFATVPDPALRHLLIDLGVLRGPQKAAQMLQELLGVPADGWIGLKTIAALKPPLLKHLVPMLIGARLAHIESRVRENPTQAVFRAGWRNRTLSFLP